MDLGFSAEDEAFRADVRKFIADNLTPEMARARAMTPSVHDDPAVLRPWQAALNRRGWVAPLWAPEYGGPGWTPTQRYIFEQECARAHTPTVSVMGIRMVAPVIMRFGSQEQKDFYLPRILSGEDHWCQGYSEPGAGSDLASLKTSAVRDGDHYVINGSKIWTSHAQYSDRMFALVRTSDGPIRQEGITFILIDMDTPGISIRPIYTIGGDHEVNQIFLDDVRVPVANRVGDEGAGWSYGKYLLEFERGGGSAAARIRQYLDDIRSLATRLAGNEPLDVGVAERLSDLEIDVDALDMVEMEMLSAVLAGENPGLKASYFKILNSELKQSVFRLGVEVLGRRSLAWEAARPLYALDHEAALADDELITLPNYLNGLATTIYGGSGEVQREIIAKALFA